MATTPSIGSFGDRLDLNIKQGSTFGPMEVTATNPDGSAMDLTACTVRGQIRKKALDTELVASFTCTITDAEEGRFSFTLSDETTADIEAGELPSLPASKYVYDMELADSQGNVIPLLYGNVTVLREVTR